MLIAVIGATGSTGSLVVDEAIAAGHEVIALSRSTPVIGRFPTHVKVCTGELNDAHFIASAIQNCDAVISCLGQSRKSKNIFAKRTSPANLLETVARATLAALKTSDAHFVYLSAFGVGQDMHNHSLIFRIILRLSSIHDAYVDHANAERILMASSSRWTIVKPVGLTDADLKLPLIDKGDQWSSFDTISKRSLAAFMVQSVESGSNIGKALTVGEP